MILSRKDKESGRIYIMLSGTVARDPKYDDKFGGKTTFSVRYENYKEEGQWQNKYMNIAARRDLADYAACLEKNDRVFLTGILTSSEYISKQTGELKTWIEVECEFLSVQQTAPQEYSAAQVNENITASGMEYEEIENEVLPF